MCQDVTLSPQGFTDKPDIDDWDFANTIADQLIARIGADRFELWFSKRDCIVTQSGNENAENPSAAKTIWIRAENQFSLQRIQSTFGNEIRSVVDQVAGPHYQVVFQLEPETESVIGLPTESAVAVIKPTQPATLALATPSEPIVREQKSRRRGVSSFWFGADNRLIEAGVTQLFERPGQFSPLFIYGPTGSGKSHLLESLTTDFRRRLRMKRCIFLSAEQFTSEFVGSLRGGTGLPMFRRKYRDLDLLAIDDIQFLANKRATLGEFQHTLDNLIRTGKQVVVTSDRPPIELGHLGNDISARLSGGLTCPLEYPDFDGRMQIVRRMCAERDLNIPTNVLRLICEQLTRDVRRLSGAINRLHAYAVSVGKTISPEVAQNVLCDLFSLSGPNCTSMVTIEQAVCEFCGVNSNELKSPSRQKRISAARMLAMYLSRQYTGSAFSEIGEYFGGRSHSTAIAAEKKVAKWIANNDGITLSHAVYPAKEVVRRIESNLRIG
ncbi:MAG: chromosomal replication initiator protein [Mariniblastus sp.]|jgi:chromosomal replication initiator protein